MDGGRKYVPTGLRGSTPGSPKCAHVPQGIWRTRRGHAASDLCRPCAPPSPGRMASAVGTLGAEDRYVGRHGGRLPHEEVARPGRVARGGGMGVRDGGMAAGRLRRRRARAAEAVAGATSGLVSASGRAALPRDGWCLERRGRSRTEALPRAAVSIPRWSRLRGSLSRSRRPFLRMIPWPARQRAR